jgi:hypothetical protein
LCPYFFSINLSHPITIQVRRTHATGKIKKARQEKRKIHKRGFSMKNNNRLENKLLECLGKARKRPGKVMTIPGNLPARE